MKADWVSVKIDTINEIVWRNINQPNEGLNFKKILKGLELFAASYKGRLNTETMLVNGINNSTSHLKQNASFIASLKPKTAYISIPTRPPAMKAVKPVREEKLTEAWRIYKTAGVHTELLAGFEGTDTGSTGNAFDDILNITAVHPLREDTVEELLRKNKSDNSVIDSLIAQRLIKGVKYKGKVYYVRSYNY